MAEAGPARDLAAPGGLRYGTPTLAELVQAAGAGPAVFLPRVEAHPAGMAVAGVALMLGVAAGAWVSPTLGWVALVVMMLAMLLHARVMRVRAGWQVDFVARRIAPHGLHGEAETIDGEGWSIVCAPGDKRQSIAIDLRHADRGRVARLYDSAPRLRGAQMKQLSELADVLARRLRVERAGPRL
jgi:hypothetical protein